MSIGSRLWYYWNVNLLGPAALRWARWRGERKAKSGAGGKSEVLTPPLRISRRTKELVGRHYLKGRYANRNSKVAWVTSGAPHRQLDGISDRRAGFQERR